MNALYQEEWGDATDVFKFGPVPALGEPAATQVKLAVRAASLNPIDIKRADGFANHMGFADESLPVLIGYDVAGVVTAVGADVDRFAVGDAVYGDIIAQSIANRAGGSVAEAVLVEADLLAKKPESLSFAAAAALPVAILTALDGFEAIKLAPGEKLLVTAGAGGVGHVAIQLAKSDLFKAGTVASTASAPKAAFVKAAGADIVVDYRASSPAAELSDYDAVFELAGDMDAVVPVLSPAAKGRIAGVATFESTDQWTAIQVVPSGAKLERLAAVIEAGQVKPAYKEFAFDEAGVMAAVAEMASGRAVGKVVIVMPGA